MPQPEHLFHEDDYGRYSMYNGERRLDALVDDPVADRMGSRTRSIGKRSGDHIRSDGTRDELILDQLKRDERHWPRDPLVGEITRHLRAPGQSGADTLIETVRFDGVTYHVPIIAAAGIVGAGSSTRPSRFYSDDNRYAFIVQGDEGGKIVQYDMRGTSDESQWVAVADFRGVRV